MDHEVEIAPGIFFITRRGQFRLVLRAGSEEIIGWDYDEIKVDPQEWYNSLKTVVLAMQHGPTITFRRVKEAKAEKQTPVGTLLCNVCNIKFMVSPGHPFVFTAKLNGKTFCDYQCSELCHRLRRENVYKEELGEVIKTFPKVMARKEKNA